MSLRIENIVSSTVRDDTVVACANKTHTRMYRGRKEEEKWGDGGEGEGEGGLGEGEGGGRRGMGGWGDVA
jgi:hypothetical protein